MPAPFRLLVTCSLLLLQVQLRAQDRDDVTIGWDPVRRLTWNDYTANPDKSSGAAASTATYLGLEYHRNEKGFSFKVHCSFSTKKSWGLYQTPYILAHEQAHFDLSEISARRLHKKMMEYRFNEKTYKEDLDRIYQAALQEKEKIQQDYDGQTNHSINRAQQELWLKKIAEMLEDTKPWAGY